MILVDAFNVLHASSVLPPDLAGLDLADLARLISGSRYEGRQVRLVCDGPGPARGFAAPAAGIHVAYAGPGREADDAIEQFLRQSDSPRETLVVSTDRRLRRAAGRRGARSITSEAFLRQLAADHARPHRAPLPPFVTDIPLDRYSVAAWAEEFGYPAPDLRDPARPPSAPPRPASGAALAAAAGAPLRLSPPGPAAGPSDGGPSRPPPASPPPPPPHAPSLAASPPLASPSTTPPAPDPWISDALREWAGRLTLEDLDMRRWL